jgi:hypothetical protein
MPLKVSKALSLKSPLLVSSSVLSGFSDAAATSLPSSVGAAIAFLG